MISVLHHYRVIKLIRHTAHMGHMINAHKILVENVMERNHSTDLGSDGGD
jgi:hypothetical protein